MIAAYAVEHNVCALAREAANFFHKALSRGIPPKSNTAGSPRDEQVPYISRPARRPSGMSAEPTPPAAP